VTSPNASLSGRSFSSEISQNLYDFPRGNIGNGTNYFDVTLTAFYSGEHVQPHSLDVDVREIIYQDKKLSKEQNVRYSTYNLP
jgi:hypothetical protein